MVTQDVVMGQSVSIKGAEYTITDEPRYVRAYGDHQMIEWVISPVPAGPATGTLHGSYRVWPDEMI